MKSWTFAARAAASIGAHRSLAKPFRAEHLVSCVEELLAAEPQPAA